RGSPPRGPSGHALLHRSCLRPVSRPLHLAKRFFTSLLPVGPSKRRREWAVSHLTDAAARVWRSLSPADRRHSVAVAERVEAMLGAAGTRPVIAAALLHDCGKIVSGFGPSRRVMAMLIAAVIGHRRTVAWGDRPGHALRRVGWYADHPRLG